MTSSGRAGGVPPSGTGQRARSPSRLQFLPTLGGSFERMIAAAGWEPGQQIEARMADPGRGGGLGQREPLGVDVWASEAAQVGKGDTQMIYPSDPLAAWTNGVRTTTGQRLGVIDTRSRASGAFRGAAPRLFGREGDATVLLEGSRGGCQGAGLLVVLSVSSAGG